MRELIHLQEDGIHPIQIDHVMDCADMFDFIPGVRAIPQDRHQRLYVMALREDRFTGKIRYCFLVPTNCMTADALTKSMASPILMNVITSCYLYLHSTLPVRIARRVPKYNYTEKYIEDMKG